MNTKNTYIIADPITGKNQKMEGSLSEAIALYHQTMINYLIKNEAAFSILQVEKSANGETWTRIHPETGTQYADVVREAIRGQYQKMVSGEDHKSFGANAIRQVLAEDGITV